VRHHQESDLCKADGMRKEVDCGLVNWRMTDKSGEVLISTTDMGHELLLLMMMMMNIKHRTRFLCDSRHSHGRQSIAPIEHIRSTEKLLIKELQT